MHGGQSYFERPSLFSLAVFTFAPNRSFEYGPSLAFAKKNTTVLQSRFDENPEKLRIGETARDEVAPVSVFRPHGTLSA